MDYYYFTSGDDSLQHHGIKGMKWGVRRYRNSDGTLTKAGKLRYGDDVVKAKEAYKTAKKDLKRTSMTYQARTLGGLVPNRSMRQKLERANDRVKWTKEDAKDAKDKVHMEYSKKSKHREKLEQDYINKGYSKEEAELAAYKRARTEKIVLAASAVAVTAAVAYGVKKYTRDYIDQTIKSGTTIQNISRNSDKNVGHTMYGSLNKWDDAKYRGMYGKALSGNGPVYETKFKAARDLKVASPKNAEKIARDLFNNDPNFKQELLQALNNQRNDPLPKRLGIVRRAMRDVDNGKFTKDVYEAMNIGLVDHSQAGETVSGKFYDAMKKAGYSAIRDTNDSKYSGYGAKDPTILFDTVKDLKRDSIRELSAKEIDFNNTNVMGGMLAKELGKSVGKYAAGAGAIAAAKSATDKRRTNKFIDDYKKKHPSTKLSRKEIARMQKR